MLGRPGFQVEVITETLEPLRGYVVAIRAGEVISVSYGVYTISSCTYVTGTTCYLQAPSSKSIHCPDFKKKKARDMEQRQKLFQGITKLLGYTV